MGFNQQKFEQELPVVKQQISRQIKFLTREQFPQINLHIFETIPSTNQTLWQLLAQGATAGTVVIAQRQTAGRGQWGRQWQSGLGGLYLSLALTPNLGAKYSTQLTIFSAWGIAMALRCYDIPVLLKWPNDLILSGRKLGGILTETRVHQGQIKQAVIGVGLNFSNCVPENGINLQSFSKQGLSSPVTCLEMLASIILQGVLSGYQYWLEVEIEVLLASYLELLESLGSRVIVEGKPGIVTGVTTTGELRVQLNLTEAMVAQLPAPASITEISLQPGTISLGYSP
ncbi:MAG: biotin--[acetyl-CoA-carboxylase] ligase [Merismopedia sp. SIO2A8]|nr:biotin--[acetyl-CoA-carboxylase] ligase [Symploca sp. SIO2B6]NET50299.1 biotin--[acetyl-CoA-carboxylase] ligase [Merismopedia sp. SIO2A8]